MSKIQKSLDLNKLLVAQKQGKLLKKKPHWPMYGSIKYDGNYTVIIKEAKGMVTYLSSGGHQYDNNKPTIFDGHDCPCGVYIAERIAKHGKLGDRKNCALTGPRTGQRAHGQKYMVHDHLTLSEYECGKSVTTYDQRYDRLVLDTTFDEKWIVENRVLHSQQEADAYLAEVQAQGYEGIMLKAINWTWVDSKSRTIDCIKYKKRPTVDLLCIGYTRGEGKYEGMIGSLRLQDSKGRVVDVGSGMSDLDRLFNPRHFIGKVVEVFYEQIMDTYIQPTFGDEYEGVLIRTDKTELDID